MVLFVRPLSALPITNPLATLDWNALRLNGDSSLWTSVASGDEKLVFQDDSASSASCCSIDSDLVGEFGRHNIRLSQAHVGSGYRVQKVLEKAARGEKLRIGLLGGSVSLGHGTNPTTGQRNQYGAVPYEQQWHQVVYQYLNRTFPLSHTFLMGAKAATTSDFFEWCWATLIGTELDLVMIEIAVNDDFTAPGTFDSSENLLRSLLSLPSAPAVLYVDSFSLVSGSGNPTLLNGQDAHNSLASYYDVPEISARPALLTAMIRDPALVGPLFNGDKRHGSAKLHRFLGSMVVAYLQQERCRLDEPAEGEQLPGGEWPGKEGLGQIPKVKMNERWNAPGSHATQPPTCKVAGNGLEPVSESKDWTLFTWRYSKFYYETTVADSSEIVFEAEVRDGGLGQLAVSYLRSRQYNLGKASCAVGKQKAVILDGYWASSTSLAQTSIVAKGLPPGKHQVRCKTLPMPPGDTAATFRIMGVMTV
ncbi:hypothetical protein JCM5296_005746 [Sporobolomyces johnsonii]